MSVVVEATRAVLVAVMAVAAGFLTWVAVAFVGISADIVGIMWSRPEDYPYEDAWLFGGVALGATVTGLILWRSMPRRPKPVNR